MSGRFPPQAHWLVAVATTCGAGLSVEQAFLLGGGSNFYYVRRPQSVPAHRISGLSPSLVLDGLGRLGFSQVEFPLAPRGKNEVPEPHVVVGDGPPNEVWAVAVEPPVAPVSGESTRWVTLTPPVTLYSPDQSLSTALAATAYAMMICSGAWQGVDGIEYFSEDLTRWEAAPDWRASAIGAAEEIAATDGLWRQAYGLALATYPPAARWAGLWQELAGEWLSLGTLLREAGERDDAGRLAYVSRRALRLAHRESRAWSRLIDAFGHGI